MAQQAESRLQTKIQKGLRRAFPGSWWVKTSGNHKVGAPDLLGCVEGIFFGFEVKVPGREDTLTKIQEEHLQQIRRAGGVASMVVSDHQARQVVEEALAARSAP